MGIFNHDRLDLARRRRGLTKTKLAEELGLSMRMLLAYERNEYSPSAATVTKMTQVLRFPEEFFTGPTLDEPPIEGSSFRALTTLSAGQREQALAAAALALALADWIEERFTLPAPAVPKFQGIDPETAAVGVRTEWGLGELPIRNMLHLLEAKGVRVFSLAEDCVALDAFSFWRNGIPYVFLNMQKSAERLRMDTAHELGHLVLHWKGGARGRETEREAEAFGSAFLMPRGSVLAEAPRGGRLVDIIRAKKRWNVAAAALTYRMHALGLLTDWQYRSLFMDISRLGYRTREPDGAPHETSQILAKVFQASRQDGLTLASIASELAISPEDVRALIFGLVLTPVGGTAARETGSSRARPNLRLV